MGIFFLAIVAPFKPSACFSGAKHSEGPPSLLVAESTASWSFPTVKMRWGLLKEVVCSRTSELRGGTSSNFQKLGQWGTPTVGRSELRLEAWGLWLLLVSTLLT